MLHLAKYIAVNFINRALFISLYLQAMPSYVAMLLDVFGLLLEKSSLDLPAFEENLVHAQYIGDIVPLTEILLKIYKQPIDSLLIEIYEQYKILSYKNCKY